MHCSSFFMLAFCLQVSAATWSQTVSYSGKDVDLKTVLAAVKKQTGYGIFYENGEAMLQSTAPVTLDLKNVPLDLFLRICLKDQPLDYSLEGTTIFIRHKSPPPSPSTGSSPPSPSADIRGRVTNDKGEPLVNANITVKRTGRGTVTDANGSFTLHNVNADDIVTVTFIGYKAQSVPLRTRTSLTLVMEPATNDLDKVVVQAYGTTSQRLATGNIVRISADDIAKQPVINALQVLQGQVAGAVVTNTTGYASGSIKIEIRGRNTINPDFPSDPLYIIDGVPLTILDISRRSSYADGSVGVIQSGVGTPAGIGQSPFFNINPADIASIEVLKDADATAIYGSRGSNGVILITTKKGSAGKAHFDFNIYSGISNTPRYFKMMNTQQYVAMRKEALANDGIPVDIYNAPDLVAWDTTRYTDWQKFLWGRTGRATDAETSLSGGDTRTTYRIGAGYHYQTDIVASSGANKRGSISININNRSIDQRLNISLSANYSVSSANLVYTPGSLTIPPNAPAIFDAKGYLNYAGWKPIDYTFPFGSLLQPYVSKTNLLTSNLLLSYEIVKGLTIKTSLGYNNIQNDQTYLTPIISQNPASNPTGSSDIGYSFVNNTIIEPQIEYNKFISQGKLNVLIGTSNQINTTKSIRTFAGGYTNDALLTSLSSGSFQSTYNQYGQYKYSAVFARINYNWRDKYIFNINARRDGSSKFGPGREFGNFASIGGAWIFSEEKLIKSALPFLSFGKIRASYGSTGGDQIGDYAYLSRWAFTRFPYNGQQPLNPTGHVDSTLHWQVNKKTEIAVDLSLFEERVSIEAVWYRNRCNNQLVNFPTPYFTGFPSVSSNSPANVQNTGIELIANWKAVNREKLKWSSKFNISLNRNKLIFYPNLLQSPYADQFIIGQSLNIKKLLHVTGVNPATGHYTFQDNNHDGRVTVDNTGRTFDDRHIIRTSPSYDGSFTNNFSFRNWELSFMIFFRKQIGMNAYATISTPGDNANQPIQVLPRWQKSGDITNIARFTTNRYSDPSYVDYFTRSDALYTNASFLRLQNLSIVYTLPKGHDKGITSGTCRVFLQGQNLFVITRYKGLDPEVQNFTMPLPRILTAGLSFNL